jgi:hypothetical protein
MNPSLCMLSQSMSNLGLPRIFSPNLLMDILHLRQLHTVFVTSVQSNTLLYRDFADLIHIFGQKIENHDIKNYLYNVVYYKLAVEKLHMKILNKHINMH